MIKKFHRIIKDNTSDLGKEWFRTGDDKLYPFQDGNDRVE